MKSCSSTRSPQSPVARTLTMASRVITLGTLLFLGLAPTLHAQDAAALQADDPPPNAIWVETLDLRNMIQSWGQPRAALAAEDHPLTLNGTVFPHGIGTHTNSKMTIDLKGSALRFASVVGVDDEILNRGRGAIIFTISVDGKEVANSGVIHGGDAPKLISVDLTGAQRMVMDVSGVNGDTGYGHADWAGAVIVLAPGATTWPESVGVTTPDTTTRLAAITPPDPHPAIHGARVVGASPHRPFLFLIPASGQTPLLYSADGLPTGLHLDPHTGIISGVLEKGGTYTLNVAVKGPAGRAVRPLSIVCGDHKLALTPPMGWNAWNVYGDTVNAAKIREQADWLVRTGLASHGFQYLIIDDSWQGRRDDAGNIGPSMRFGDIKSLADYLHKRGLKLGIYSSPNEHTCSGYAGSQGHEQQDAAFYAASGVDYLKYDWCREGSNAQNTSAEEMKTAYGKMRAALDTVNRDIVYAITPYGFGYAWDWAGQIGANSWWTSAEILDNWDSMEKAGLALVDRARYAGPGHWNDPGWLMVGKMGSSTPHFTHLKPGEQMVQVSLWSMLASPLILSCDLTQLNPNNFYPLTTNLLTNDEILDIDQDPLGKAATRLGWSNDVEVLSRPLWDGTRAVGIFNKQYWPQQTSIKWSDLGLSGSQAVRDLWQHKDLGEFSESYTATVPRHGVIMLKIGKPQTSAASQVALK